MLTKYSKHLVFLAFFGCGERRENAKLQDINLEFTNTPIRSECWGFDGNSQTTVPVEWDDQSELRVCMLLQKDGALGFDIRLRTESADIRRRAVLVELRNPNGQSASSVFPLRWNPFNGLYELQLTQGCLIAQPNGCAQMAPAAMQDLFRPLPHSESDWRPAAQLLLSLELFEAKSKKPRDEREGIYRRTYVFTWPSLTQPAQRKTEP